MDDITIKYNLLNKTGMKKIKDFMNFLLNKQKKNKKNKTSSYKEKILNVSTWSDSDLKIFQENTSHFKQWTIQEW